MGKLYDVAPIEGFEPQTGILLATLADSTREWRENLGKPKAEAIVWQPWPDSYSIGALILHMIDCEAYWFETFASGKRRDKEEVKVLLSEETKQYGGRWPKSHTRSIDWYFGLQDEIRSRTWESLREIPPERPYERKDYALTLRWIVAHVVEHDSYHGGQAVLLHEMWKKVGPQAAKSQGRSSRIAE